MADRGARVRLVALLAGIALAQPACGGRPVAGSAGAGAGAEAGAGPAATTQVAPSATVITVATTTIPPRPGRSILPDVTVDDVAGGTVNLASLAPSPRPLLLWFWAPT